MERTGFSFYNSWYPLVQSTEITQKEPYGIKLLGTPLVLYRDKTNTAHCYIDKCPHRSAKLSVGLIVDGTLECKYHGWQFADDGQCVRIPSVDPSKPITTSYCVTSYHTVERWGLIWVFMGDQNLATQIPLPEHLFREYEDNAKWRITRGSRDFDIDHGLMIENLLDPAHLPFTHEGTLSKREHAEELSFSVLFDNLFGKEEKSILDLPNGFYGCQGEVYPTRRPKQGFVFQAPCTVRIDIPTSKGKKLIQLCFCVPITPTKMRLNYVFVRDFAKFLSYVPGSNRIFQWTSDKITEQDVELLVGQQKNLQAGAAEFNTAVSADKLGVRYRRWRAITEDSEEVWFSGFQEKALADIEDLVPASESSKQTRKAKKVPKIEIFESADGGKDFKTRERISFFAPSVKWGALSVVGVAVVVFVFVNKFARR